MDYRGLSGQSAIEYLMTYGWMLLVVAVTGGAIFSMVGEQSISEVSGFNANDVGVEDFGVSANNLQMNVRATGARSLKLRELRIYDEGQNITIPLNNRISQGDNKVISTPHISNQNNNNELEIELLYDAGGLENISASGTIRGNLGFDNSLTAYWTFKSQQSNNTHVYDISSNDWTEPISGAEFQQTEMGETLIFNGEDSNIDISRPFVEQNIDTEGTISLWVKPREHTDRAHLFTMSDDTGNVGTWVSSSRNKFAALNNNGTLYLLDDRDPGTTSLSTDTEFELNEWQLLTITWEDSNDRLEVYNDGVLEEEFATSDFNLDKFSEGASDLRIGRSSISGERAFDGSIAHFKIYDRKLTSSKIEQLYDNPGLIQ